MARIDKTKKDAYMLKTLIDMFEGGDIRTDHPLQRNPGRWTTDYRDGEIATIIKEENMDTIKICEQITVDEVTGKKRIENWLIDGLQRLTYAMKYRMGAFKMGKNIEFPIISFTRAVKDDEGNFVLDKDGRRVYEDVEFDLRGKGYNDLPSELQNSFDSYCIDVVKHLDCSNEEIGYHIRRYNKQTNMNMSEKTITYLDTIAESIKDLSAHEFFKNCTKISTNEKIKGTVNKVVIESLMILNFFEDWTKDSKKQGLYLEEKATEENFEQLSNILDKFSDIITESNEQLFSSKNTFLWVKMYKYFTDNYNLPDEEFSNYLDALQDGLSEEKVELLNAIKIYGEEVTETSFKTLDEGKSTKDKNVVINKLHILETLMNKYFKDNDDSENTDDNTAVEENNDVVVISGKDVHIEEIENRDNKEENKDNDSEMETIDFVRKYVNKDVTEEDIDDYFDYIDSCANVSKIVKPNAAVISTDNENAIIGVVCYAYTHDIDMDLWLQRYSVSHVTISENMSQKDRLFSMIKSLNNFEAMRKRTGVM